MSEEFDPKAESSSVEVNDAGASHSADKYGSRPLNLEDASTRTVGSKESIRQKLEEDIERFLSQGGSVKVVGTNVTADPPRKPVSNYGSRPI